MILSGSGDKTGHKFFMLRPDRKGIAVTCAVCNLRKKPVGRSAPHEMANSLCDHECSGYYLMPLVGSLWPGESEEDFGYPVSPWGTTDDKRE